MKPTPTDAHCPLLRVAESHLGNVALCGNGTAIHLTLQCLTVRMEPAAFLELVNMVTTARESVVGIFARAAELASNDPPEGTAALAPPTAQIDCGFPASGEAKVDEPELTAQLATHDFSGRIH